MHQFPVSAFKRWGGWFASCGKRNECQRNKRYSWNVILTAMLIVGNAHSAEAELIQFKATLSSIHLVE
jgi:hypothetical protein